MDEIKVHDRKVFIKSILTFPKLLAIIFALSIFFSGLLQLGTATGSALTNVFFAIVIIGGTLALAYRKSLSKRWLHPKFRELYEACQDRRSRLADGLKKMKKSKIADLQELPASADKLLADIYIALRKADLLLHEINLSESRSAPPVGNTNRFVSDQQAQELFKVADRNIAEYSQHFKSVVAGIERSEAQAVVFATTLDTLRVRMLGYRLTGRAVEADTREFLNVVTEAKMQFEAIDKALDEIELTPFPEIVSIPSSDLNRENDSPPPIKPDHLQSAKNAESSETDQHESL